MYRFFISDSSLAINGVDIDLSALSDSFTSDWMLAGPFPFTATSGMTNIAFAYTGTSSSLSIDLVSVVCGAQEPTPCDKCEEGFYPKDLDCVPCETIDGCKECLPDMETCLKCQYGYEEDGIGGCEKKKRHHGGSRRHHYRY